jgi:HD-GYP domain-containing protein (c-di-GMP phosphodiesterase class II)
MTTVEFELQNKDSHKSFEAKCFRQSNAHIVVVIRDITDLKTAKAAVRKQLEFMTALSESAQELSKEFDSHALGKYITRSCVEQYGATIAWIGYIGPLNIIQPLATWPENDQLDVPLSEIEPSAAELDIILKKKTHLVYEKVLTSPYTLKSKTFFPLISHNKVVGVLGLLSEKTGFFTAERIDFYHAYSLLATSAVENIRLFETSNYLTTREEPTKTLDQTVQSAIDLKSTIEVTLAESLKQLDVDAMSLLVLDTVTQTLNFASGYGFQHDTFRHTHIKIGENFAGRVAKEKRSVLARDLKNNPQSFSRAKMFNQEGFEVYLGVPLIARTELRGVLEIFWRHGFEPNQDWLTKLESVSRQIATAIDNALLVETLQQKNLELSTAYDATIEGLARALELRDHVTEGHTRRVAEMTWFMGQQLNIKESDLNQLRRGALLHDIGKMGIPDSILLKPGSLTQEEWKVMRQHPAYAYELLSGIEHLRPALDIPLYHHEKYDGSGYPFGLKAEQIPLAARIFSIVDVFDALTSDRPYRRSWKREQALDYIRSQSGFHFDPQLVDEFIKLSSNNGFPVRGEAVYVPAEPNRKQEFDRPI